MNHRVGEAAKVLQALKSEVTSYEGTDGCD